MLKWVRELPSLLTLFQDVLYYIHGHQNRTKKDDAVKHRLTPN